MSGSGLKYYTAVGLGSATARKPRVRVGLGPVFQFSPGVDFHVFRQSMSHLFFDSMSLLMNETAVDIVELLTIIKSQ